MSIGSTRENPKYPLTFNVDTSAWMFVKKAIKQALRELLQQSPTTYKASQQAVLDYFSTTPLSLQHPVAVDDDARAILDVVFSAEQELIQEHRRQHESLRRLGRHVREFLADDLLNRHLHYLEDIIARGRKAP